MKTKTIAIAGIGLLLLAGFVNAFGMGMFGWNPRGFAAPGYGYGGYGGYGMGMHGFGGGMGFGGYGFGPGRGGAAPGYDTYAPGVAPVGGFGGCMGNGIGFGVVPQGEPLTIEEAKEIAESYAIAGTELKEIYEFETHFEAEFKEENSDYNAFEIIIDKYTGAVRPEMGPNMMWNTKYGMHGFYGTTEMTISDEEAKRIAQEYLAALGLQWQLSDDVEKYYGFYELHGLEDGEVVAQINVNGYTGTVFIEQWHGKVIDELEVEEE